MFLVPSETFLLADVGESRQLLRQTLAHIEPILPHIEPTGSSDPPGEAASLLALYSTVIVTLTELLCNLNTLPAAALDDLQTLWNFWMKMFQFYYFVDQSKKPVNK